MIAAISLVFRFLGVLAGMLSKFAAGKMEQERFRRWRKVDAYNKLKKAVEARRAANQHGGDTGRLPDDGFKREE